MITYVIPTHDRHEELARTLERISALGPHEAEVLIIDNASPSPVHTWRVLPSGIGVRCIRTKRNLGAAARNLASHYASERSTWLVMLDDDSHPLDLGHMRAIREASPDVHAIAAEIMLSPKPDDIVRREAGGLPEVFTGCGAAIRADVFRGLGGYDPSFDFYAEEYDLSARILLAGGRVRFDRRFRVMHRKVSTGRNQGRIIGRLARNNAWVAARYAPAGYVSTEVIRQLRRYGGIARKESCIGAYLRSVLELPTTLGVQPRRPMPLELWDRFTGLSVVREALTQAKRALASPSCIDEAAIVAPGKNVHIIREAARELGYRFVDDASHASVWIIGTLSPGPMLDAWDAHAASAKAAGRSLIMPWRIDEHATRLGTQPARENVAA